MKLEKQLKLYKPKYIICLKALQKCSPKCSPKSYKPPNYIKPKYIICLKALQKCSSKCSPNAYYLYSSFRVTKPFSMFYLLVTLTILDIFKPFFFLKFDKVFVSNVHFNSEVGKHAISWLLNSFWYFLPLL